MNRLLKNLFCQFSAYVFKNLDDIHWVILNSVFIFCHVRHYFNTRISEYNLIIRQDLFAYEVAGSSAFGTEVALLLAFTFIQNTKRYCIAITKRINLD